MRFKVIAICFYVTLIYWISLQFQTLHTLFFPTIGAFSLLFILKPFKQKEMWKIALGAVISSVIGSLLVQLNAGALSLLATLLIVTSLILKFNWNAPPILAVALIPFFSKPEVVWAAPLSVCGVLIGLVATLYAAALCEKWVQSIPALSKFYANTETDNGI